MLGSKHNEEQAEREQQERRELHQQLLERLALDAELVALHGRAALVEKYDKRLADDIASYKFKCERWGGFLSVLISRQGLFYAGAINLGDASTIDFVEGKPPSLNGGLRYVASREYDAKGQSLGYAVNPCYRYDDSSVPMISTASNGGWAGHCGSSREANPRHVTPNWPKPSEDDQIIFTGIRTTLHIPFGRGQEVYETILGSQR